MSQEIIPLSVPNLKGNERKYVAKSVETEWVSTVGSYVEKFEKDFAEYAKIENTAAVQSGTAALHLAMIISGVGAGDIVITPTLTFVAAVNPIRYVGAEPVFMDCDDSLCINPAKLERYLINECEMRGNNAFDRTLEKPVKAIVVVHIYGNGAAMEHIMDIAKHFNLQVIEDATEAVGTFYTSGKYAGHMAGTIGDFGAYSFNGNKIITTGGGGMFVARNPKYVKRAKHLSTQAKVDGLYYDHDEIGFNYRMTNLQAALGVAQLEQLEGFIDTKRKNYQYYQELGIKLLQFCDYARPNYWFYSYMSKDRDKQIKYLSELHIQTRPIWKLIHTLPMYKKCRLYDIDIAEKYYNDILNIPCSSNLSLEDVERVAFVIRDFESR